jgi:phage/plasmid-like protein (TIGR03299 family)
MGLPAQHNKTLKTPLNSHAVLGTLLLEVIHMAHEITKNSITGKDEVFVAGEPAWHNLGVNVKETQKWEEAMKMASLDWAVNKKQLLVQHGSSAPQEVDAYGIFRGDNNAFLGACGDVYTPIQNKKAFDFVDVLLQADDGAHYVSAGSLNGGSQIWCLAKVPEEIRIKGTDDVTKNYLLFTNYHVAGKAAISKNVNQRVVCANTMNIALHEEFSDNVLRLRHDGTIDQKMEMAKKLLAGARGQIKSLNELMNILARTKMNMAAIGDVLRTLYPNIDESVAEQDKAREILHIYEHNDGDVFKSERGTAYNLLNAVTNYTDHKAPVRPRATETEAQARARVAMFGKGESLKFLAMQSLLMAITKHSLGTVDEKKFHFLY